MSAFTDRYPIEVLHEIIKVKYGSVKAKHWIAIMKRQFPMNGSSITYNCGNPMGILSS